MFHDYTVHCMPKLIQNKVFDNLTMRLTESCLQFEIHKWCANDNFLWFENGSLCTYMYICIFVKQYHTSTGMLLVLYLSAKHIVQIIQPTGFLSTLRVGNIHWHKMKGYYRHPYEYMVLHAM